MDAVSEAALAESLEEPTAASTDDAVAAVLLAAGMSTRFGSDLKQLVRIDGEALVHRALRTVLEARRRLAVPLSVYLVLGHRADEVRQAIDDLIHAAPHIRILNNSEYHRGQSTSVRCAVRYLLDSVPDTLGAFFLPIDQPAMDANTLERLVTAHRQGHGKIIVPRHRNRRGAPVFFDRTYFPQLADLTGDQGGRRLIQQHHDVVHWLELDSESPLDDIDTPEDLSRWKAGEPPA